MSAQSFKNVQWKHVKGKNIYGITGFPLREKDLMPQVSYRRADGTGPEFTRTCEEFFDGRYRTYLDFGEEEDEKIALDVNDRSIVAGDYVQLYVGNADDRARWGVTARRKVLEVVSPSVVKLEHLDEAQQKTQWSSKGLRYDGSRPE